jgi:signal transduction histidine kinase/DNA-binding response OmpR family regulator
MILDWLLDVPSTDPDDARRRQLLNILLLGTAVLVVVALLLAAASDLFDWGEQGQLVQLYISSLATLVGLVVIFAINRYGPGWLASLLFLFLLTFALALADEPQEVVAGRSLFTFAIPILMASFLLRPVASIAIAVLNSVVLAVIGLRMQIVPPLPSLLGFFALALVSWLVARSLERMLEDLRRTNLELDRRVDDRTKDLAEALAREHAESGRNQAILSGIADGVIVLDDRGKAIVANPAIGHILERPTEEILGSDIGTLMAGNVEDKEQKMILDLLGDKDARRASIKFGWGDKTLSVSFAPVVSTYGEVSGTVAVFRDFTREAEIDRMKSDFVSIVSHELRTPLTSIQGYLDLLLLGASGSISMQQESFLRIARENAQRLHDLVSDLLDISRIESGGSDLDVQVVSMDKVVQQVANSLEKEFDDRDLTLTLEIPPDLPEIFADAGRLVQILNNLLSNAYKYTREGGATVRAHVADGVMQVDVIDTGVGISEEDQAMLFTRFFRAEDTDIRQQPGTGLGLNITKSLVEMHGGEIWVESEPGKGTQISFTLPLPAGLVEKMPIAVGESVGPVPETAKTPGAPPRAIPAGPWILVADDEPDIAHLFRHQLEAAGYRVSVVTQGSRVVEVARQLQPELITLDLLMDVDGLTVLNELKADPITADIPVVIASVMTDQVEEIDLEVADYLVKPLDEGELLNAVRLTLGQLGGEARNKILVVDDEVDIAGWLRHFLTHYGYEVTEAYDGAQALEAVASSMPDLILLDLKMPRMDGLTTIRRLREQKETRHIPIVVLSAYPVSDEEERAQMLDMGVKEFLRKPITVEQLVAEVQKHLGTGSSG